MILPATAFDEFCAHNKVTFLDETPRAATGADAGIGDWRLRDAVHHRLK